jgi:hypothetical protein
MDYEIPPYSGHEGASTVYGAGYRLAKVWGNRRACQHGRERASSTTASVSIAA